eukprot:360848-Chlamydomonas_euryale.AAC.1
MEGRPRDRWAGSSNLAHEIWNHGKVEGQQLREHGIWATGKWRGSNFGSTGYGPRESGGAAT